MRIRLGFLLALVLCATAAKAQDTAPAREPANGVPFEPRTGWFTETQVGVFTAFGGEKSFSNGEPWLALSLGADIPGVKHLELFLTVGHGSNGADCHSLDAQNNCSMWNLPDGSPAGGDAIENFSVMPLEAGLRWGFVNITHRLLPSIVVVGGYAFMRPWPAPPADPTTGVVPLGSVEVGGGLGLEYETRLPGLTVAAEVLVRYTLTPGIASLTAYPRIQYVF